MYIITRVIALPSVKYNRPVEAVVFDSCDLGGARRVESLPVVKITIDPKPCMTMLLEKLQKATGLWEIAVSVCNIFSRISYGCCG